jgi:hypothetical protein
MAQQDDIVLMAHLMRRAGFGASRDELETRVATGYDATVEELLHPETQPPVDPYTLLRHQPAALLPGGQPPMGNVNYMYYLVNTKRPLEEKMALFWHHVFATGNSKVDNYDQLLEQIDLFRNRGMGNYRDLLLTIAKNPTMIFWLDNNQNHGTAVNENWGRELLELFSLGAGNYTEVDVREASRAFTGWIDDDLAFKLDADKHDDGQKTFLGRTGNFDGVDILTSILEQKVTAEFIAGKLYRFFVREELSEPLQARLGAILRDNNYEIAPLLRTLFLSRDFYSAPSFGTRIKGPIELIVSTYRKLGVKRLPGIPDLNLVSRELGQILLNPPTVAGWAQGRTWITPGLLLARGNFARDVLFPDVINFTDPNFNPGREVRRVNDRILAGMEIAVATIEDSPGEGGGMAGMEGGEKTMANVIASAEDFNTRYGSLVGWQEAVRRVKPIPRAAAQFDLAAMVLGAGAKTASDAVDHLLMRLLRVPVDAEVRRILIELLERKLGTSDLTLAATYLERPLRLMAHLIMSSPQYQLC